MKTGILNKIEGANNALFPCLNKNNSSVDIKQLTTAQKKSAYALERNVKSFVEYFGLDNVGFLTLTFADHVTDRIEAQRRFNILRTEFLKKYYPNYIRVIERTKSGRIHYHLLVSTRENIRKGLNFNQIAQRNYKSASAAIRKHWERLRNTLPKYGFGRAELLPIKSNSKGLSKYIAKYIGKTIGNRLPEDKGMRLCQTSQDLEGRWKIVRNCNFQFVSRGSKLMRSCIGRFVYFVAMVFDDCNFNYLNYTEKLRDYLGQYWFYKNRDLIFSFVDDDIVLERLLVIKENEEFWKSKIYG